MWSEADGGERRGATRARWQSLEPSHRRQRTVLTVVAARGVEPNPEQPRKYFAEEALAELAASILERGLLQPIVVRRHGDGYQLLAGERRFRAAQLAGLDRLPASSARTATRWRSRSSRTCSARTWPARGGGGAGRPDRAPRLQPPRGRRPPREEPPVRVEHAGAQPAARAVKAELHREGRQLLPRGADGHRPAADTGAALTLWNRLKLDAMSVRRFREEQGAGPRARPAGRDAIRGGAAAESGAATAAAAGGDRRRGRGALRRVLRRTRRLIEGLHGDAVERGALAGLTSARSELLSSVCDGSGHVSLRVFQPGPGVPTHAQPERDIAIGLALFAGILRHDDGSTATVERNVGLRGGSAVELEPESVLPSQYFAQAAVDASLQPEKRLMLAVLEDAVGTFQKYVERPRADSAQRLFAEVEDWFASDDQDWPYSFVNISHALGLDAAYLRAGLARWRDRQRSRSAGPRATWSASPSDA